MLKFYNYMNIDYSKICSDLLSGLNEREKEIISRRFGLGGKNREALEAIGKDFGITRERVRQIQNRAILKIKPKLEKYQKVFEGFLEYFKKFGNLRKEEKVLEELGGEKWKNEVLFLLTIQKPFQRFAKKDEDFYPFWTIDPNFVKDLKETINELIKKFQKIKKPLTKEEILSISTKKEPILSSFLEISKKIQQNSEGLYGLKDWPEINPRGIKDKIYLVFKKVQKPLHFQEITRLIEKAKLETVHNELIRDPRFVLVGRGIYALAEWGYIPGEVKDVILHVLKKSKRPLTKEEILEQVKKQRLVKESTILVNLCNKKYFQKDPQGRYRVREI
jgi:predicted Zn-ribbon and HTH transcriptional regulator